MERENGVERKPQGFRRVGAIKSRRNRDFLLGKIEAGSVTVGRKEINSALTRGTRLAVKEGGGPTRQPEIKGGGARAGELGRLLDRARGTSGLRAGFQGLLPFSFLIS